jgi:hypothetical protein
MRSRSESVRLSRLCPVRSYGRKKPRLGISSRPHPRPLSRPTGEGSWRSDYRVVAARRRRPNGPTVLDGKPLPLTAGFCYNTASGCQYGAFQKKCNVGQVANLPKHGRLAICPTLAELHRALAVCLGERPGLAAALNDQVQCGE